MTVPSHPPWLVGPKLVPFDEKYQRFYDMAHKKAVADGGEPLDPNNLKPQQHDEHMAEHMERGDFKRWGTRANQAKMTAEEIRELEMEMQMEIEIRKNLNPPPPQRTYWRPPGVMGNGFSPQYLILLQRRVSRPI
jgi:hypothetical protein